MKRLYVGGLSHSITQKDLKDRFGKFGDVEDVELRTRSDDEGVPYKTFSYINIKISDGDLKKCMTVLNKSKWKGGTLQIEAAKESFLHRLAEERQEAAAPQPAAEDKKQKMLDSLSKAGVDEFTMKAAVPGTEVPGHKDWVVSKFGRVLPVLQLRCRQGSRARTMKYDPSKYCHNIRRLDRTDGEPPPPLTPVARLAWEERGGDDDISRKRRGEFSPYETPRRKTSRPDAAGSQSAGGGARSKRTVDGAEARRLANGVKPPTPKGPAQGAGPRFTDWDLDPEEEIRKAAAAQSASHDALRPEEGEEKEVEEDTMEVVGLDYFVKSGQKDDEDENDYDSADTDELFASRKPPPLPLPALPPAEERPTPPATAALLSGHDGDRKRKMKMKKKSHAVEEEDESSDAEEEDESSDAEEEVASGKASAEQRTRNQSKKMKMLPVVDLPSSDSEEEDEEEEAADSSSDSDYDAMFSNVTRLEISLADLQKLAEVSQQASEQEVALPAERPAAKKGTTPEEILAALMEDSSEEEEEQEETKKKKKKKKTSLPAFQGTRALSEGTEGEETRRHKGREEEKEGSGGSEVKKQKLDSKASGPNINGREGTESESSDEDEEVEEEEEEEAAVKVVKNMAETASSSSSEEEEEEAVKVVKNMADSSSSDEEEEEEEAVKVVKNMADSSSSDEEEEEEEAVKVVKNMADSSSSDEEEKMPAKAASSSSSSSSSEEEEEDKQQAPPRVPLGAKEEEERQRKANARRLAAVQQRQKEAEQHKQLIQGALANLDAPRAGAGKRIVFGSDDDDDDEDEQRATSAVTRSKATALQNGRAEVEAAGEEVRRKPKATQLFGGSEDEDEEDAEEEEDGSRFDIRPQFEGRGGQKLMELQSRFGTDERFRMDSRFLEEEEEEEDKGEESENKTSVTEEEEALEEERKKSLSILQSVLGGGGQLACGVKTPAKTKTFRDVAALHYDPSKEEHAAFETKTDAAKKESKAARRKKREEAQKLPEVSKEIYYDVSGDLKAVFGPTKDGDAAAAAAANAAAEGDEEANWDQEDEAEEATKDEQPAPQSTLLSADPENEEASGFKFSFFEDAAETGSGETAEYKVESIQAPKVSWQQDLRFQDSSSDEEEEEKALEEEEEEQSGAAAAGTTQEETPSKTGGFFFFLGDSRLTEGPGSFCRPAQLEEQREQWEERRTQLREEYRKKHKDARRRLRSSLKS
ncbi:nucleolar protein 8 [Clinocottus analis]|uniref:nucleolar protein 8 n=1 Tax=Clinocottus analis TaxID=304258 RepID=UPI0035C13742